MDLDREFDFTGSRVNFKVSMLLDFALTQGKESGEGSHKNQGFFKFPIYRKYKGKELKRTRF